MLIWRYTSRRIAMASGKTVPPRRGEMLDRETGEPVQNWSNQHAQTTCMTNAETGEVEQTPSSNIHSDRRRPFQRGSPYSAFSSSCASTCGPTKPTNTARTPA
ncbi:uncharacterized protein LOC111875168 isoform X2 [Cryptotermes secundus]|uniref:uncharacterized protein LOC111875168 isoform X2 n=1 Tax=Cryptotermes secundus TaxID=105785 RepID=UPI000CD7C78A|nr:uncharacterized protein LOC111875168 isoform X2 [Cryptotermes secundus]